MRKGATQLYQGGISISQQQAVYDYAVSFLSGHRIHFSFFEKLGRQQEQGSLDNILKKVKYYKF